MTTAVSAVSDDELALGSSSGSRTAFEALYERHYRGVYDLACRMLRDEDAAADVVQTTFTNAWVKSSKFTDLEAGSTGLMKQTIVLEHEGLQRED